MDFIEGEFISINKPYRMSSFGALAYVRTRLSRAVGVRRVKIGGDRAYKLKRQGEQVELKAKTVRIDGIEVTDFDADLMLLSIRVQCGKGTYIRALARDIGRALQSGAYLTALCRTRVGDVRIEDCITLDDFPDWLSRQDIVRKVKE